MPRVIFATAEKMRILLLFVLVAWYVPNVEPQAGELYSRPTKTYKESLAIFAKESFKVVAENRTGNFVFSPVGASILLTMAAFGAKGRTARGMRAGLALPPDDVETSDEIVTILNNLNRPQAYAMRMTSKIFTPELYRPNQNFLHACEWIFKSPVQAVDFSNRISAIRVLNEWSGAETDGRVKEIIEPEFIANNTELVLLTTGYVESNWRLPFRSHRTIDRPFYVNENKVYNVMTMFASGYFPYGELTQFDATFVELPFANTPAGDAVSMYVILPNRRNGLRDLLKNFDKIDMFALMSATRHSIKISLPKFKFESALYLRKPLVNLGFGHMFLLAANFSGITDNRLLSVSNVIQKMYINVDEDDDQVDPVSQSDFPQLDSLKEFNVDHPFVCVIMKEDGIPFFIAVVNEPRYNVPKGHRRPFNGQWVWPLV